MIEGIFSILGLLISSDFFIGILWYNNDISKVALLCSGVFDALSDGKITEEEIEKMLAEAEDPEKVEEAKKGNFIVNFINGIIESLKAKIKKE